MSHYMFMAADFPLEERDYQRPQTIWIEAEGGFMVVKTDEPDPDFMVQKAHEDLIEQVLTEKEFGYELWFDKLSDRGRSELKDYIKGNIRPGGEIEMWSTWLGHDGDEIRVEYWEVPLDEFSEADIEEWDSCRPWLPEYIELKQCEGQPEQWIERLTQYCMIIKD